MDEPANPYAPPRSELAASDEAAANVTDLDEADIGHRLANGVIDQAVIGFVSLTISLLIIALDATDAEAVAALVGMLTWWVYYVGFEGFLGRTPAKFWTGTRVVSRTGGAPTFGQIMRRTLIRLVPFDAVSYLWGVENGWHDKWSETRVVQNL